MMPYIHEGIEIIHLGPQEHISEKFVERIADVSVPQLHVYKRWKSRETLRRSKCLILSFRKKLLR